MTHHRMAGLVLISSRCGRASFPSRVPECKTNRKGTGMYFASELKWNSFSTLLSHHIQNFNIQQFVRSAHTVFTCFVFIWEQTATCATYSINWLVFITEKFLQRGTDWVFKQRSLRFVCKGLILKIGSRMSNKLIPEYQNIGTTSNSADESLHWQEIAPQV